MSSVILRGAVRLLQPLLLLFSVFLLLAGHNEPGGGFAGGLVAAAAFALLALSHGPAAARRSLGTSPRGLFVLGLAMAAAAGVWPLVLGRPLFTALWGRLPLGTEGMKVGTPLLFDLGVYLVVVGVTLTLVLTLAGEED